jgi:S-formylglutathione hydrolase FrmB
MDFAATLFSTGWASGVNAYGTVALLGILGRLDVGAVPPDLERTPVIAIALALFGLEFVVDKIPGLDSLWDSVHTVIRPLIALVLGFQFADQSGITGIHEALGAGSSGAVALASHSAKAGLRLGINASPEPASNFLASLTEDGLVAIVVLFSINHPVLAAALAAVFLATGLTLVALIWRRIAGAVRRWRRRRSGEPPNPPGQRSRGPGMLGRVLAVLCLLSVLGVGLAIWTLATDEGYDADPQGAEVTRLSVDSDAIGASQPVSVVIPAGGGEGRPLLVFLHGRGDDEQSYLVEPMFEALHGLGDRAPVVAFPDGGDSSYWHDRSSGEWARYVIDEVIPEAVEASGADADRVAIGGISMGGFGAFDLARLNPGEFCAVGGHSPAIWATAGETAAGAFDDADDFAGHDLVTAAATDPAGLDGPELWLDAGDADPFLPGDDAFVAGLEASGLTIERHTWPGGHDGEYWNAHWDEYLDFYAEALAAC